MKQHLCNTAVERSPEYRVKTRKQDVKNCAQNATFLLRKGGDVNKYMHLLSFFQNGR